MKKYLCLIFILISILCIIVAFNLFIKEQIVLNVNSNNKEDFKKAIQNDKINNIDQITKIELGQGWHSSELFIHYSLGKEEKN